MNRPKLIVFDLDLTLWDHEDASRLTPPYRREGSVLIDSKGERLALREDALDVLVKLKSRGILLAVASWNEPRVREILDALGISRLFDVICIEPHPNKEVMLKKILNHVRSRGISVKPSEVILVDDNPMHREHAEKVGVRFVQFGKDIRRLSDLLSLVE